MSFGLFATALSNCHNKKVKCLCASQRLLIYLTSKVTRAQKHRHSQILSGVINTLEITKAMKVPAKAYFESLKQHNSLNASSSQLLNNAAKAMTTAPNAASHTSNGPAKVDTIQAVHCPTCGRAAERRYSAKSMQVRTQCSSCDYLMVTCAKTGRVIESYAPSFSPMAFSARLAAS